MTLNSTNNFQPFEVKCVINDFQNLDEKIKTRLSNVTVQYSHLYDVNSFYFVYGLSIDIHGDVEFLIRGGYGFAPAWLFETNYEIPQDWHIKSYMHEENILRYENYSFHVPNIIMGFKELVYQKNFIINLIEGYKEEYEIFESYQQYEKDLRQKRAEAAAVKYMYPYQPPSK